MKQFAVSKLKKEYSLYIDRYFVEQANKVNVVEQPTFYSKLYLIPYQNIAPNLKVEVPVEFMNFYNRKRLFLVYKVTRVDHEKKELFASLDSFYVCSFCSSHSNFEFNNSGTFKEPNLTFKYKILLNKKDSRAKPCSKRIQKQISDDILKSLRNLELTSLDQLLKLILEHQFSKRVSAKMEKNLEYYRALVVLEAKRG